MARILIADDSSIMRRNLSAILTKAGHTIIAEATNGEEAVKLFSETKPDLVTMDITMPKLDGITAVKKIISLDPNAKIIMISALEQKFMVLAAVQNGAKHYVIKPFSAEKVVSVVDAVLESRGAKAAKNLKRQEAYCTRPQVIRSGPDTALNNTINEISISIDDINNAIKEIDNGS